MDVFRVRHGRRISFTRIGTGGAASAARLDRFYVSHSLLPFVCQSTIPSTPVVLHPGVFLSDHRPVSLALLPVGPSDPCCPPLRRVRVAFVADKDLLGDFQRRVSAILSLLPTDPAALLAEWPRTKCRLADLARAANIRFRAQNRPIEAEATTVDLDSLYARVESGDATAVSRIITAQAAYRRASMGCAVARDIRVRRTWLHSREYPTPALTRRLQPPRARVGIPAMRLPSGILTSRPSAISRLVVRHWASVAAAPSPPPPLSTAFSDVMASLSSRPPPSPSPDLSSLSVRIVSPDEVEKALRHSRGGTSPGLDGIPVELYRCCWEHFAPVLARLFSAAWQLQQLPQGFHDGLITVLHKAGDCSDPANYRPITLLGTDYRLFAKILASRLGAVIGPIISPHQTAFLPGRRIGDNVMSLQLIQQWLVATNQSAIIAFCDFVKAYDTVDRNFLFRVMETLGVPTPFVDVVRLLLSGTRACAMVNGDLSDMVPFLAGVRQGCPLAPLLYLFIGEALHRWLSSRGLGLLMAGERWVDLQYADDTEVLLANECHVGLFVDAMNIFSVASGQRLHMDKTRLLPVGARLRSPPASIAGLAVVDRAHALGFDFHAGNGSPSVDWDALLQRVTSAFDRLRSIRLSPMGRGLASSAYGVSKLLYHAEFVDVPRAVLGALQRAVGRLVLGVEGDKHRLFTIPFSSVCGSPREGGFGGLPWPQHIRARLISWAGRFLRGDLPWTRLARALLADVPLVQVADVPFVFPRLEAVPLPLRRLFLAALPRDGLPPPHFPVTPFTPWLGKWRRCSWPVGTGGAQVPITSISVRQATQLLLADVVAWRSRKFSAVASAAGGTIEDVQRRFAAVWRLPWDNRYKAVLWGLLYDAFPCADRLGGFSVGPCVCGHIAPNRRHFFWDCPVAQHLVSELQRCLSSLSPLTVAHVWLGVVPSGVGGRVWCLVSLAALVAMNHARLLGMARNMALHPSSVDAVSHRVVARFWSLLEDFRVLGPPDSFVSGGPQPFFRFDDSSGLWSLVR